MTETTVVSSRQEPSPERTAADMRSWYDIRIHILLFSSAYLRRSERLQPYIDKTGPDPIRNRGLYLWHSAGDMYIKEEVEVRKKQPNTRE